MHDVKDYNELKNKVNELEKRLARYENIENALHQSKDRLNLLLNASNCGIWDFNIQEIKEIYKEKERYNLRNVKNNHHNDGWFQRFGYSSKDMDQTEMLWKKIVHPDDIDAVMRQFADHLSDADHLNNMGEFSVEYRIRTKKGMYHWIHSIGKVVTLDGNVKSGRMVCIHIDVTDRKNAEEEKKRLETKTLQAYKMEALGTLAGGIAHDFNNILGIILGNTELAIDDTQNQPNVQENLQEIVNACQRAKDIIKQILPFNYQDNQQLKPLKIAQVVRDAVKLLQSSIPSTVRIRDNILKVPSMVMANETQLSQILINLCVNSTHAMGGRGVIDINLSQEILGKDMVSRFHDLSPGHYIKLSVGDNGCGISPQIQKKIFDPYFTTKPIGEGTGMGLAVVHAIIRNLGGEISVFSELHKGTVIEIYLPVITLEDTRGSINPILHKVSPKGQGHVLLIDDEKQMVQMVQKMLELLGYRVTPMISSIDALAFFKSQSENIDIVISDLTMPDMCGGDLTRELIKIRKDIPIILCTGYDDHISRKVAGDLGIKYILQKPITKNDMAIAIQKMLKP